jgi:hypothetical protein
LHLDHRYDAEVEDIITSPPVREPYITLKTELVRRLSPSREQHDHQLLTLEEMGGRKPSQFLRYLRNLAPNLFLRCMWSGRLPPNVQVILAGQPEGGLDAAARISEATSQPALASVVPLPDSTAFLQRIEDLSCQVA